jgi:hypothetical protein
MDEAALFMTRQSARCASDRSADAWARVVVGSLRILMATLCALLRGERRLTRRKQSIFFLGQLYGVFSRPIGSTVCARDVLNDLKPWWAWPPG